jgi:hypothetical protein
VPDLIYLNMIHNIVFNTNESAKVELRLKNSSGTSISETLTFEISNNCSKHKSIELYYLNRLGGFDRVNFNRLSTEPTEIERKTFRKDVEVNYYIDAQDKVVANSDWLNNTEAANLKELFTSPVVFQYKNSQLLPVIIESETFNKGKRENAKLIQYQIEFRYAFKENIQRQ